MEILVFWLICGFVSLAVASSRGASGCAAFAWGILLGPFGIIIAFVLPSNRPVAPALVQPAGSEMEKGNQRICPHCRSYIPALATVCRYCQRESEASSREHSNGVEVPALVGCSNDAHKWTNSGRSDARWTCSKCGAHSNWPEA